jgi:hypothetical protein
MRLSKKMSGSRGEAMMYEILCTHSGITSWLLRLWMWSKSSHSVIYDTEKHLVTHSTFFGKGVEQISADEFFSKYTIIKKTAIDIAPDDLPDARLWLAEQRGKRYDATALVGIAMHRDWQEDSAWFCSELVETFRARFSKPRFSAKLSRITPGHQEMLA